MKKYIFPKMYNIKLKKLVILLIVLEITVMGGILSSTFAQQYVSANQAAEQYTQIALHQTISSLQYNFDQIKSAAKEISYNSYVSKFLLAEEASERREMTDSVLSLLSNTEKLNGNIYQIALMDNNGGMLTSNGSAYAVESGQGYSFFSLLDVEKVTAPDFSGHYADGTVLHLNKTNLGLYSYSIPIYSVLASNSLAKIGSCTFILRVDKIEDLLDTLDVNPEVGICLRDANKREIYVNASSFSGIAGNESKKGRPDEILIDNTTYKIQQAEFMPFGWTATSMISQQAMNASMLEILRFWVLTFLIAVVVTVIIGAAIIRNITRPVAKISEFTSRWGDSSQRLVVDSENEIGRLAENINHLLDTVQQSSESVIAANTQLYETRLHQKQSELSALQSQINPHFLYNTLDCVRSIALANEVDEISLIAESMSRIFRYSIKGEDIVSVAQEIECVEDYMGIIRTRFPEKITFKTDIEAESLKLEIPKMILQPIVENAVYHGLEAKRGKGTLEICGRLIEESVLCFEITDDGVGMSADEVKRLNSELSEIGTGFISDSDKRSIGLKNIAGRLSLTYGSRCGMTITSEPFLRTTIRLFMEVSPRKQ